MPQQPAEIGTVEGAVLEAQRFIKLAEAFLREQQTGNVMPSVRRSAMRRASLDLTRALAGVRLARACW